MHNAIVSKVRFASAIGPTKPGITAAADVGSQNKKQITTNCRSGRWHSGNVKG